MTPSILDFFHAFHGPWRKGRRVTAVIFGYADGSGSHLGSKSGPAKVRCIGALLGDQDAWIDLCERWNNVLDKPEWPSRIQKFHMVDCVNHVGEFENWSYAERLALFGDLVGVIIASPEIHAIGSSNIIDHFKALPSADLALLKAEHLGTPAEIVCQYSFQRIITITRERFSESEQVALTFDNEPAPDGEEYHKIYNEYATRYPLSDTLACRSLNFASARDFPPLQAADVLAYTTYQWEMETYYPKDAEPYFPVIPAFLRMVKAIEPDGGRYNLEGLQSLIASIKAGKRMPLNPYIQEKGVLCSKPDCGKPFVVTYDTRTPSPETIMKLPCPHCKQLNDVIWP
ncbi:MAG TPA: hypothetical protein VG488_07535 [Candidatus Angelobacter sp.]|jgi:hypothetical protein|nr:hypothetical protein [Candidatus Angelobacter sp.]